MEMVLNFLRLNWALIVFVIIMIAYTIVVGFRETVYKFFLAAEKRFPADDGKIKMDFVVIKIYEKLPFIVSIVISRELFKKILQKLYDKGKDYLDDGLINNSV